MIFYILVGIGLLFLFGKLLSIPIKIIFHLVVNGLVGAVILYLFNWILGIWNITLPITPITAVLTGLIGIPFVILLVLFHVLA